MPYSAPTYVSVTGRLTADEKRRLKDLAARSIEAGRTPSAGKIAFAMCRHPSTINRALQTMGLRKPCMRRRPTYERNGAVVRGFTEAEDKYLNEARAAGGKIADIRASWRDRFGYTRSIPTLIHRATQLANLEET